MKRNGRFKDITGQRFGKLVTVSYSGSRKTASKSNNQSYWKCRCDCGAVVDVLRGSLIKGRTQSCGCNVRTANGDASRATKAPEYQAWTGMIKRCENTKSRSWPDYGGRGIKVCSKWRKSYATFLADVGRRPSPAHSLDRIDVNGNYEPGNVRWATREVQRANRRPMQRCNWRQAAKHAYAVVEAFENVLASYTGAPHVITCDSCTDALTLACMYTRVGTVEIPRRTYCSVPMSIIHAGGEVRFRDESWSGMYQLKPYQIYDCARLLTTKMYRPGTLMCLSFHWSKHLPIGRGGAILCDDPKAAEWLKRARFDGRKQGVEPRLDKGLIVGIHSYMTPPLAAQGLMLMADMAEHNEPLPNSDYPDLSTMEIFR